jgi:hypothetical protein
LQAHAIRVLTSGGSTTDATSFTTASVAIKENELALLAVVNSHASAATTPTCTGWTQIATVTFGTSYRVTLFRRQDAGGSSGTHAISFGATTQTGCRWQIVGFPQAVVDSGNNGAAAVGNSQTGTASAAAITINYPASVKPTSAGYVVFGNNGNTAMTPRTNWTEEVDAGHATPNMRIETQRRLVLGTETAASSATSITGGGIVVEVFLNAAAQAVAEGVWRRRMSGILRR